MLCPSCNTENRDNAKFCKNCGRTISFDLPAHAVSLHEFGALPQSPQLEKEENAPPQTAGSASPVPPSPPFSDEAEATVYEAPPPPPEEPNAQAQSDFDIANEETIYFPLKRDPEPEPEPASPVAQEPGDDEKTEVPSLDISAYPTIIMAPPATETEEEATEPTLPSVEEMEEETDPSTPQTAETVAEEPSDEVSDQKEKETMTQETNSAAFPVLAVGDTLLDRYEITETFSKSEQEHIYAVTDHQGYHRCWNCDSDENAEGDEYCTACGAELNNTAYLLYEYPATSKTQEDQVVQGSIVNTFVHEGQTYLVVQQQETQNSFPLGARLLVGGESDNGEVRRADANEDSIVFINFQRIHESVAYPVGLYVVADGMGGHANGQGASRMAIAVLSQKILQELLSPPLELETSEQEPQELEGDAMETLVRGAVEAANKAICQINQREKSDMGCTLTGFMVVGDQAYIFNVGDSRTYMVRDGGIYRLTVDHSLVEQMVAGGLIEADEVYTHPQRSQIFRSIGDKPNVQVDIFRQQIHPGDILLSCSDGLWEMVRDPHIAQILSNAPDPQTASSQLIEAANANGGEDNVSAVVVCVR